MKAYKTLLRGGESRRSKPDVFAGLPRSLCSLAMTCFILIIFITQAHAEPDITTGLVGHWKLDETTGTTAADSTSGNNGTLTGGLDAAADSVGGRLGTALNFDGAGDYIDIPTTLPTGDFSYTVWINPETLPSGSGQKIFSAANNSGGDEILLGWEDNNTLEVQINNGVTFNSAGQLGVNQWHHLALTRQGSAVALYQNGNEIGNGTASATLNFNGCQLLLGADNDSGGCTNNVNDFFDGVFDDVRIYNRVLTPEDIAYLYSSYDGNIKYSEDGRVPKFFDGSNWQSMGKRKYVPNAVNFDGTNDSLDRAGDLTGISDTKMWSGYGWFKRQSTGSHIIYTATSSSAKVRFKSTDEFEVAAANSALTDILICESGSTYTDTNWHSFIFSFDLTDSNKQHLYIDDTDELGTPCSTYTDDLINASTSNHQVGSNSGGSANWFDGDMADLWLDFGTYIDLSVESNRRKFIDENGDPVYLGASGSIPTGAAPDIFLIGDTATWHTNKGTGGGFTENGALTDASSPATKNYSWQQLGNAFDTGTSGEYAFAVLDESTIVWAIDSGTLQTYSWDSTDWSAVGNPLAISNANNLVMTKLDQNLIAIARGGNNTLDTWRWDGTDWSQVGNSIAITDVSIVTALTNDTVATVRNGATSYLETYVWDGVDWSKVGNSLAVIDDRTVIATLDSTTIVMSEETNDNLTTYNWDGTDWSQVGNSYNIAGAGRSAIATISNNTIAHIEDTNDVLQTYTWNGSDWSPLGSSLSLGAINRAYITSFKRNTIALESTIDGDLITYSFANCSSPTRSSGATIYNAAGQVMQYCDGENWQAMGPVPGAGTGGCSNPTRAEGSMVFNKDKGLMQYCDGDDWIGIGADCPLIGNVCDDGTIYIGKNDYGAGPTKVYISPNTQGDIVWSIIAAADDIAVDSEDDGKLNVAQLSPLSNYPAAEFCENLVLHGKSDWYLPARSESYLITEGNYPAISSNVIDTLEPGPKQWASTERTNINARTISLSGVGPNEHPKTNTRPVRCFRRD